MSQAPATTMESEVSDDSYSDSDSDGSIESQTKRDDNEDMSDSSKQPSLPPTSLRTTTPISSSEENQPQPSTSTSQNPPLTDEEGVSSNSANSPKHRVSPSKSAVKKKKTTKGRITKKTKTMSEPPSIFRLRIPLLRDYFGGNKSESKLIRKLMHQVNRSLKKKKHPKYKKEPLTELKTPFGFQIVGYTQKTKHHDELCKQVDYTKPQISRNRMTFYFRENEIFVLTIRQGWQPIRKYCCLSFPNKINNRLTTDQGNSVQKDQLLVGNESSSHTSRRDPSNLFERLDSVTVEKTRVIRANSSVFNLEGFKRKPSRGRKPDSYKIRTGLAYVRILKKIEACHMPEILDHFSKICNDKPTETTDGESEEDIETHAHAKSVIRKEREPLDSALHQLLFDHLTNLSRDLRPLEIFDLNDKCWKAYQTAISFQLVTPSGESLGSYTSPPSSREVFSKLQEEFQGKELEFHQFISRLKRVQIHYHPQGRGSTVIRRGILQLIDGEMEVGGESYLRMRGLWFYLLDEFHVKLNDQFLDLLNQNRRVLSKRAAKKLFPLSWSDCGGVEEYVRKYVRTFPAAANYHYFLPPDMGGGDKKKLFDLLVVRKIKKRFTINLLYIFERFDAGLRFSSVKILTSLEEMFATDDKKGQEIFELFRSRNIDKQKEFRQVFKGLTSFKDFKDIDKRLVIACPTGSGGDGKPEATFLKEKRLSRKISKKRLTVDIIKRHVERQQLIRRKITTACSSQKAADNHCPPEKAAGILFDGLVKKGYCKIDGKKGTEASFTGKLLRLIDDSKFKMTGDDKANTELFKFLKRFYLTKCPGYFHKLECIDLYKGADRNLQFPKLELRFANICKLN